jgi:predicted AlkP superfamily pyrophosphatase or phosphodiesterase
VKRERILSILLFLCTVPGLDAAERPRLVLYISIDQMKAEYFDWYRQEFTGGFRRFLNGGTLFTNADLNFAPSETGPGHAALGTGTYPAHSGIPSNEWTDPKTRKVTYCVEDKTAGTVDGEGGGFSPKNLVVTAIGDWLKASSPESRVIALSSKDRAAILMGGQHPDLTFWYDASTGHMVTSDYYMHHTPDWVQEFNSTDWVEHNVPDAWCKILPDSVYSNYGPDELKGEMIWEGSTSFPHAFRPGKKKSQLTMTPYGDALVLDFAREAVRSEKLGQRGRTDLLLLGLSCTDYVGHEFGGNSQEMLDNLIRLDRNLGAFITDLETIVGRGKVLVVLSADHASMPLPEYMETIQHRFARRINLKNDLVPSIDALDKKLQKDLKSTERVIQSYAFLNYAAAATAHVDSTELERRVSEGLHRIDGITDVYFRREILNSSNDNRPYLGYFQRGYYPPRGKDFMVLPCEYCLLTSSKTGTTHGSPYRYDTHIPILFWGSGVGYATVAATAYSVDIAPTVARLLGIAYPTTVDGEPLKEITR